MSTIDNRIVSMTFDNENFERRLAATLDSLDALSESLRLAEAQEGLSGIAQAVDEVDFSNMASSIDTIRDRFSALGAVAFTLIQDLTRATIDFAERTAHLLIDPIKEGGLQRALNLEQAKFLFEGLGMDIEASMASALKAVEGTAYGLDVAAKTAAQLGGSGLRAGEDMTRALRGIAGIAGITNTSYEEMADIFITAAGNGKVMSMELARISHRGVNAAAALAKEWGVTEEEVRRMASEGEISFEKFALAMDSAFGEHAQKANQTYTGSLANLKAALSRLGASFLGPHLVQQRDLFNALRPAVDRFHDAVKPLISTLLSLKQIGISALIDTFEGFDFANLKLSMPNWQQGLQDMFVGFSQVISSIKEAFSDIFPPSATSTVIRLSEAFREFAERIKMGEDTLESLKSVFRGFFSAISIGIEIVKETAGLFKDLFSTLADASGLESSGILDFFANLGETIVDLKKLLVDSGGIAGFFDGLAYAIKHPIEFVHALKDAISNLFSGRGGIPGGDVASALVERLGDRFEHLKGVVETVGNAISWLGDRFEGLRDVAGGVVEWIVNWFSELGYKLAEAMNPSDFNAAVDIVNVGLLGGIAVLLKKFLSGGFAGAFGKITEGVMAPITGALEKMTGVLEAMQMQLRAKTLMQIAGAIGALTVSMVALSLIDSEDLTKALIAISVGFGQLIGAMALIEKVSTGMGALKFGAIATGMTVLAAALGVLSLAVRNLSSLSWSELAKGLLGVSVMLGALVAATRLISADVGGLIRAGIAMGGIATALLILSTAVKSFAELSWGEMVKGLAGVGVGLAMLVGAVNLMPAAGMIQQGIGLIAIATGMRILAEAVQAFSGFSWGEMTKGLAGIGAGLLIVAGAMHLMPPNMIGTSAGLLLLSVALNIMAKAVESMGSIKMGDLAKGLGGVAAMLAILAVAMNAMTGAVTGAASLVIVSGALAILAGVLKTLSTMSIGELAIGIGAIAVALAVLGGAALLLQPLTPALMSLGLALALVGGAFALFGTGASLVAKAFETIAKTGKKAISIVLDVIQELITYLPKLIGALAETLIGVAQEFLDAAPTLIKALSVILGHLLQTVIENVPLIAEALGSLISAGIMLMEEKLPELIQAGFKILMALLQGIQDNIGQITETVINILSNFAASISANMQTIIDSGLSVLFSFLEAIGSRVDDIIAAGVELLVNLLLGISQNIQKVIDAATLVIINFITGITDAALLIVETGTQLLVNFLLGISQNITKVVEAVTLVVTTFISTLSENAQEIITAGFAALLQFISGITANIGEVTRAVGTMITEFITEVGRQAGRILTAGTDTLLEFLKGVRDNSDRVLRAFTRTGLHIMNSLANEIVFTVNKAAEILIDFLNKLAEAIRRNSGKLRDAGVNIASAIASGMTFGFSEKVGDVAKGAIGLAGGALNGALGFLGVRSPSKKFIEVGHQIAEGLRVGLDKDRGAQQSAAELAERVVNRFETALSRINEIAVELDANPVITPIIDLTKVQSASKLLRELINVSTITPIVSFAQARTIATTDELSRASEEPPYTGPTEVTFEQNIYSPTALSTNDIYRSTKSQIALAKEELGI